MSDATIYFRSFSGRINIDAINVIDLIYYILFDVLFGFYVLFLLSIVNDKSQCVLEALVRDVAIVLI